MVKIVCKRNSHQAHYITRQGNVFISVCQSFCSRGRVWHIPLGRYPPRQTPLGRHPPGRHTHTPCPVHAGTHTPYPVHAGIHTPPGQGMLGYTTPPAQCMLGYGQQTGGTHPTEMHTCSCISFLVTVEDQDIPETFGIIKCSLPILAARLPAL